jgi:hypothetical protein
MLATDLKSLLVWDNMAGPLQIKFLPNGQVCVCVCVVGVRVCVCG